MVQVSKTNTGLVAYAKAQLGLPYWYGTYGQIADEALYKRKKAQYPNQYTAPDFPAQYGNRVYDCVGLIKGYMWTSSPAGKPVYNSAQDKNVGGMIKACSKTGNIKSIPSTPGTLVFIGTSHVGIYDGSGGVYEARGHAYGVVYTKLNDRPWDKWGLLSWITYKTAVSTTVFQMTVKEWQKAAIADGYKFPKHGADGIWGAECEAVAKKANCYERTIYKNKNLTKLIQQFVGVTVDGKFGPATRAAVKKYQGANGLVADGVVGTKTYKKMLGILIDPTKPTA